MKIRVSARNVLPLMLLLTLYAGGTLYLAERLLPCSCVADEGQFRVSILDKSVDFLTSFSTEGRFGSWLGNSWAPGSFGWTTRVEASSAKVDSEDIGVVDCEDPPLEPVLPIRSPSTTTHYDFIPATHVSIVVVAPQQRVEPEETPVARTISIGAKKDAEHVWCRQIS